MERLRGQVRPHGGRRTYVDRKWRTVRYAVSDIPTWARRDWLHASGLTGLTRIHTASRNCNRAGIATRAICRNASFFFHSSPISDPSGIPKLTSLLVHGISLHCVFQSFFFFLDVKVRNNFFVCIVNEIERDIEMKEIHKVKRERCYDYDTLPIAYFLSRIIMIPRKHVTIWYEKLQGVSIVQNFPT